MRLRRLTTLLVAAAAAICIMVAGPAMAQDYNEAPMLKELVDAGELPPVEERLPAEPLVIEPHEEIGEYGGTLERAMHGPADYHAFSRINYESILRWAPDPADGIMAGIARDWSFSEDGTRMRLYLREGHKWSDGHPFTADDILFWWEDIANDPEIHASPPSYWSVGGEPMTMTKISDTEILIEFAAPHGLAAEQLAKRGNQWPLVFERWGFYAPKHYLSQFHPRYNEDATYEDFEEAADDWNVDRPVLNPWMLTEVREGEVVIAERNPYYYQVDPEGNQLPYIDRVRHQIAEDREVINLRVVAGEIDMQLRHLTVDDFPLFVENEERGGYTTITWSTTQASSPTLFINFNHKDEQLRELIQTLDFRIALSHAIDRELINDIAFRGLGTPRQVAALEEFPFYVEGSAELYADYDLDRANQLLDDLGYTETDLDGYRLFPDGTRIELVIMVSAPADQSTLDALEIVQEGWRDAGVFTTINPVERSLFQTRLADSDHDVAVWGQAGGMAVVLDPHGFVPIREGWTRWASDYGAWYETGGERGIEPTGDIRAAQRLYDRIQITPDESERSEIAREMLKLFAENVWAIGTVGRQPAVAVVADNLKNVPEDNISDWDYMSPGHTMPAQYFFDN